MLENMSVNEMDVLQTSSYRESDLKQVLKSNAFEPTNFRNSYHSVKILEVLQSLRKYVESDFSCLLNKYW